MQVSFEKLDGLKRQIKATIPADKAESMRQSEAQKLAKQVRLQGFRPGKAPVKMVQKMYLSDINGRILNAQFEAAFQEAAKDNEFRMAGQPIIDTLEMEAGEPITFTANFEVYPEIEPVDIDGKTVEQIVAAVADEDLDEMIERLQKQHATYSESDKKAKKGDRITVDFDGTIDGEAFEGGSAKDMTIEVGGGQMLADFDKGLKDMKAGEEKTISVAFPEDYPAETLQGKTAAFVIKAHKVEKAELPEVDEAFAKQFNVDSVEKFKEELMTNMNRELDERVNSKNKEAILDVWLEANEFDVPAALIQQESMVMAKDMGIGEPAEGADKEQHQQMIEQFFGERAKKRVALGLLMGAYISNREIKVDEAKLDARLETLSSSYEDPEEVKRHYKQDRQAAASLQALILEDQVVEALRDSAKISEVSKPFSELMSEQQPGAMRG